MATGFNPGSSQALAFLSQLLTSRNVDPRAAQAVFSVEGASGGIGDGGHAFGPGQFNNAGGVWTGRYAGMSPQQINSIAWSRQGLTELANRVASVAAGQHGAQAVQSIVRRFERPADPNGEVSRALAHYGKGYTNVSAPAGSYGSPAQGMSLTPLQGFSPNQSLMASLIAQQNAYLSGGDISTAPTLPQMMQQYNAQGGVPFFKAPEPVAVPKAGKGSLKILGNTAGENPAFLSALQNAVRGVGGTQIKLTSGYRDPAHNAAVGGVQGSLHLKGDAMDGYALIGGKWVPLGTALLPVAKKYGLRSGDVAGFFNGGRDPVHVDYGASL